jgi:hypothetical protein
MPGSIKIDDGSGNYTILTNAGSLGSDKTLTIPNETATIATTNGITEADQWRLTANITSDTDITSNLARPNGTAESYFGTGMTESSGIFTFPSSGYWLVTFTVTSTAVNDSYNQFSIYTSSNSGTDYDEITETYNGSGSGTAGGTSTISVLLDITDASTHRVKFRVASLSGSTVRGNADENSTNMTFLRLGDT